MKLYKILCLTAIAGLLTSCNEWLTVEPDTEFDQSKLLSNEAGYADAMSGIYTKMISNNLYGGNMTWHLLELMGGGTKVLYGDNESCQGFYFHPKSEYYTESYRNNMIDPIWNEEYNTIANVNSLLGSIDENAGVFTGNDYNIFKGELLGLRAFLHFDVLRLFADAYSSADYSADKTYIPYVNSLTSNVHPLLTNNQVCELMLKDLEAAKEYLKSDPMYTDSNPSEYVCSAVTGNKNNRDKYGIKSWHNRRFHFNYYAAVATEARIYLWMGDKANALRCAKEVIDAPEGTFTWVNPTLVSNVSSSEGYVPRDRTFSTEQIFAMNITNLEDRLDGYMVEKEASFSDGGNIIEFNDDVFDAATRQYDIRYAYLKTTANIWGTEYNISNKYVKDNDSGNNYSPWSANRLCLIRLSEMYYIAAECENDLQKATEYLETVRRHRGLTAYPLNVTSKSELQEQIRLEYHKDMIGKGQTFYYYKRMNLPITNQAAWNTHEITPDLFTMPRPDDENTYGGRNSQ